MPGCQPCSAAGYTPLGSGLEAKCIVPFVITPARNNFLKKPVLVIFFLLLPSRCHMESDSLIARSTMPVLLRHVHNGEPWDTPGNARLLLVSLATKKPTPHTPSLGC